MTDWIIISFLVLAGIGLIVIEIIFIPGTTVVGIMGFLMGGYGIYRSYELFGTQTGHFVLVGSAVLGFSAIIGSFKSNAWKRLALEGSIDSKVNENLTDGLEAGQEGVSKSSLKPVGKVEFDNKEFEVSTIGNFVEENKPVKIIKIDRNKIYVEPIK